MTAFAHAVDLIFEDANMALDGLYKVGGAGSGSTVRVIRRAPDVIASYGDARIVSDTIRIDLRQWQVAVPKGGDTVTIGSSIYELRGDPISDSEGLIWTCEARLL